MKLFFKNKDLELKLKKIVERLNLSYLNVLCTDTITDSVEKVLFFGDNCELPSNYFIIDKNKMIMSLFNYVEQNSENFFEVSISNLNIKESPCSIYLKINNKMLKLFNVGDYVDDKLKEYQEKGIKSIFIQKDDFYIWAQTLSLRFCINNFKLNPSEESEMFLSMVYDSAKDIGISASSINSFKEISTRMEEIVNDNGIIELLNNFKNAKSGKYLYSHSTLTALISLDLLRRFDFCNNKNKDRIVVASFLHDIGFDNPDNAKYELLTASQIGKLPKEIRLDIESHAIGAINVLIKSKVDSEIVNIIKEHHAFTDYSGIKVSMKKMSRLSVIFTLSHVFASLAIGTSFQMKKVFEELYKYMDSIRDNSFDSIKEEFKKLISTYNQN